MTKSNNVAEESVEQGQIAQSDLAFRSPQGASIVQNGSRRGEFIIFVAFVEDNATMSAMWSCIDRILCKTEGSRPY